jgi:hypothetical protein
MNPGHFLVDPMWEKLKRPKVYVALPSIYGYLNNFVWITDLGFIRKVCWLRIKQFFRWLNPINWWKRRKALKVLLRFERESRALVRNNKRNFKFFMVDKATENKEKNNDLDRHDYPNENNDSK